MKHVVEKNNLGVSTLHGYVVHNLETNLEICEHSIFPPKKFSYLCDYCYFIIKPVIFSKSHNWHWFSCNFNRVDNCRIYISPNSQFDIISNRLCVIRPHDINDFRKNFVYYFYLHRFDRKLHISISA